MGFSATVSARALIGRRDDLGFLVHDGSSPHWNCSRRRLAPAPGCRMIQSGSPGQTL